MRRLVCKTRNRCLLRLKSEPLGLKHAPISSLKVAQLLLVTVRRHASTSGPDRVIGCEDALLNRNRGRLCAVAHFQLFDNVPDVVANGEVADLNGAADLLI